MDKTLQQNLKDKEERDQTWKTVVYVGTRLQQVNDKR